jgi:hypothetical protein
MTFEWMPFFSCFYNHLVHLDYNFWGEFRFCLHCLMASHPQINQQMTANGSSRLETELRALTNDNKAELLIAASGKVRSCVHLALLFFSSCPT